MILPALIYASTIVLYLTVRGRLDRKMAAFDRQALETEPDDTSIFER
ncbi:hypothetical protein [Nocardia xishanensis]